MIYSPPFLQGFIISRISFFLNKYILFRLNVYTGNENSFKTQRSKTAYADIKNAIYSSFGFNIFSQLISSVNIKNFAMFPLTCIMSNPRNVAKFSALGLFTYCRGTFPTIVQPKPFMRSVTYMLLNNICQLLCRKKKIFVPTARLLHPYRRV
ncbi:MAG: hypothetical protein K0R78_2199 [Pelosinus sp.]|nr:hypothetical protein [Pelosinus sp.]